MGDLSQHFDSSEFTCRCGCGLDEVSYVLIFSLEYLRRRLGNLPILVNSGCRCESHNRAVGGAKRSQHLVLPGVRPCRAADIRIPGRTLQEIARGALGVQHFADGGIGVYPEAGFVHLDVRAYTGKPARWHVVGGAYKPGWPDGYPKEEV